MTRRRLRALLCLLSAALALPALFATSANAAASPGVSALSAYVQQHHAETAQAVALLFGFLAAHATAWLTHADAPPALKAKIAAAATIVAGVVASVAWAPGQPWYSWVKAIGAALLGSQGTYLLREVTGLNVTQRLGLSIGQPAPRKRATRKAAAVKGQD